MNFAEKLTHLIGAFGHPFLPMGFVSLNTLNSGDDIIYSLHIGDRDISFDKDGNWKAQGFTVGDARKWKIERFYPPKVSDNTFPVAGKDEQS